MIPESELIANPTMGREYWRLSPIRLGDITRALRTVRGLKNRVFVVGGVITEGETLRDIDIVVLDLDDIAKIKKALGKFAKRAHFMLQKKAPPAPEYLVVTGKEPKSVDLWARRKKIGRIPPYEYAGRV